MSEPSTESEPIVWDGENGEQCPSRHPEHGYRCDLLADHDGWAHYYEVDHAADGKPTQVARWQNHPLRNACGRCGYEAGSTSVMYHVMREHPDSLRRVSFAIDDEVPDFTLVPFEGEVDEW